MTRNKQTGQSGFPLLSFIFLIFLALKLAGIGTVATWSWWAVTSPLWGGTIVILALAMLLVVLEDKK